MDWYLEPPASARVLRFSPSYRWVIIICLATLGFTFLGLDLPLVHSGAPLIVLAICALEVALFAFLAVWAFRRLNDRVAVSDDGVWYLSGQGPSTFIRWDEVSSVEARDLTKYLVVSDSTGRRRIKLAYQLEDFDELRNLVLSRTAERRRSTPAARVFRRSYLNFGFLLGGLLMWAVFAALALRGSHTGVAVWCVGLGALTIYALGREPSRITVSNRSIDIDSPWRRRSVPFDSVTNIEVENFSSSRSGVSAAVFIDTVNGRPLRLAGMREGSVALYDALHSAWSATRDAGAVSPSAFEAPEKTSQQQEAVAGPQPSASPALPAVFHLGIRMWAVLIGPALLYSILILGEELYYASFYALDWLGVAGFWFALFAIHILFLLVKVPRRVTVSRDSLTVQYTLWRRVLRYRTISAIELTKGRGFRGERTDLVRIRLSNGRILKLGGMREGAQELYRILHAAWVTDPSRTAAEAGALGDAGNAGYRKRRQAAHFVRMLPAWFAPAIFALVLAGAVLAVHGKAGRLRLPWLMRPAAEPLSAADRKALARFPHPRVGWSGAPQAVYSGEIYDHRWNVNYATGAFTYNQTDFFINDSIPINLTRVYLNRFWSPAFGVGMNASYDMLLEGDANRFTYIDLVMPDGAAFYFKRISPGTSWVGAVFRCAAESRGYSGPIKGSKLWWNGDGWTLRLTNGTLMKFPAVRGNVRPGQGAVTSIRDSRGDLLKIERDREGNILRIVSPHHAIVTLEHDRKNRIIRATDSFGHTVSYSYDNVGRLVAVDDSRQGTTRYSYAGRDELVKITRPGGKVWLRIKYDAYGRVAKLTFENGSYRRYAYRTDRMGSIVAVKVTPSDAPAREVNIVGGPASVKVTAASGS